VADGRYELRVVAKDSRDNPPSEALMDARVSDPITVDNLPPTIHDLRYQLLPGGRVRISGQVSDTTTRIDAVHYTVDSQDKWAAVRPTDDVFDAPQEQFEFEVGGLSAGEHWIAIRARDAQNNTAYAALIVTIGE